MHETTGKTVMYFMNSLVSHMSEKLAKIIRSNMKPFRIRQLTGYVRAKGGSLIH